VIKLNYFIIVFYCVVLFGVINTAELFQDPSGQEDSIEINQELETSSESLSIREGLRRITNGFKRLGEGLEIFGHIAEDEGDLSLMKLLINDLLTQENQTVREILEALGLMPYQRSSYSPHLLIGIGSYCLGIITIMLLIKFKYPKVWIQMWTLNFNRWGY
jgi:hypothetical protein